MKILSARFLLFAFGGILGAIALNMNPSYQAIAAIPTERSPVINPPPMTVSKTEFGVKIVDPKGKVDFFSTNQVPLKVGNAYGWRIKIDNYRGEVKWREVLHLPKPPEAWATQNTENFSISKDGTTATSQRVEKPVNGTIENFWKIAPGDPIGKHKIEVYINDHVIAAFDFEISAIK